MKYLMRIVRAAIAAVMLMAGVANAYAASPGDTFFNKGCTAMKTMTVASQNTAISYFTKAKAAYDSSSSKSKCDQMISVCRSNIQNIQSKPSTSPKQQPTTPSQPKTQTVIVKEKEKKTELRLSNQEMSLSPDAKTFTIYVTTNADSWFVAAPPTAQGDSFLKVRKVDAHSFEVTCPANATTAARSQNVEVSAGSETRTLAIRQSGRTAPQQPKQEAVIAEVKVTVKDEFGHMVTSDISVKSSRDTARKGSVLEGDFHIKSMPGDVVTVSAPGYQTQTFTTKPNVYSYDVRLPKIQTRYIQLMILGSNEDYVTNATVSVANPGGTAAQYTDFPAGGRLQVTEGSTITVKAPGYYSITRTLNAPLSDIYRIKLSPDGSMPVAQKNTVTGRIVDKKGEPMIGAVVNIEGKSGGVCTDIDGNFTINAKPGDVLVTSYVKHKTVRTTVQAGKTYYVITM